LGNFFTIREVLKKYDPEVVRFFILNSHYRSPLNYSDKHLDEAKAAITTLYTALQDLKITDSTDETEYDAAFSKAMDDDFNTPEAIAVLFGVAREINRLKDKNKVSAEILAGLFKRLGANLGLLERDPDVFRTGKGDDDYEIEDFIAKRLHARNQKDWAESDRIRDELAGKGVVLEDSPEGGTSWRRR
jgi:cysteinyl-tRNA synthetase